MYAVFSDKLNLQKSNLRDVNNDVIWYIVTLTFMTIL